MSANRDNGFTLIELLVTLMVLVIVTTVAMPAFSSVIRDNRMITRANNLMAAMMYARSEAGTRRSTVRVCAGNGDNDCKDGNWEDGWVVIDDGEVLRSWPKLDDGMTLTVSPNTNSISYEGRGWVDAKRTLVLCDARGATSARALNISATGRAAMAQREGGTGDTTVDDIDGKDVQCPD